MKQQIKELLKKEAERYISENKEKWLKVIISTAPFILPILTAVLRLFFALLFI